MSTNDTTTSRDITNQWGPIANREYQAAPDYNINDLDKYLAELPELSDEDFTITAQSAIHTSALVNNFRGNWDADHCKATACYVESKRRHIAAGHTEACRGTTLYSRAHARFARSQGYTPDHESACTCGKPNAAA